MGITTLPGVLVVVAAGFLSGEWRDAGHKSQMQMCFAVAILIVAASIMAWGNAL